MSKTIYHDGSESDLLAIVSDNHPQQKIDEALKSNPSWGVRYHLAPEREQLLAWYDFNFQGTLLEVGAGCGALTGLFCRKVKHVTALELTPIRSEILKKRHQAKTNLKVVTENIETWKSDEKFDYVTCIGVLEYAAKYLKHQEPPKHLLKRLKAFLKPGGTLILAIENKFGLKYWAGAPEDHTSRYFDSIENYPSSEGIKTFSKKELADLLRDAGFSQTTFYYPLPDYKFPVECFSDHYLPTASHNVLMGILPSYHSHERKYLFNEKRVMDNLIASGQFDFFANSFLVFAQA